MNYHSLLHGVFELLCFEAVGSATKCAKTDLKVVIKSAAGAASLVRLHEQAS